MKTVQICSSGHSETQRLAYCAIRQRLVCAESCALTEREVFLLNLSVLPHPSVMRESTRETFEKSVIYKIDRDEW